MNLLKLAQNIQWHLAYTPDPDKHISDKAWTHYDIYNQRVRVLQVSGKRANAGIIRDALNNVAESLNAHNNISESSQAFVEFMAKLAVLVGQVELIYREESSTDG